MDLKRNENVRELAKLSQQAKFNPKTISTMYTHKYLLGGKDTLINRICILLWLEELKHWINDNHNMIIVTQHYTQNWYSWRIQRYIDIEYDRIWCDEIECEMNEPSIESALIMALIKSFNLINI